MMTQSSTRIIVLGAGIAGLLFTLRLSGKMDRKSVQITMIDEKEERHDPGNQHIIPDGRGDYGPV
jgi:NADH dehydrogenase FAD-containing subunit